MTAIVIMVGIVVLVLTGIVVASWIYSRGEDKQRLRQKKLDDKAREKYHDDLKKIDKDFPPIDILDPNDILSGKVSRHSDKTTVSPNKSSGSK